MTAEAILGLLQFADGLFPAGAFAHSHGLETFVQDDVIRDAAGVEQFVRGYLQGAAGPADAVAVANTLRAARAGNLGPCLTLDADLEAMKVASEARAASRQLGRQTARILVELSNDPLPAEFNRLAEANLTPCHHAVVFGIAGGTLEWGPHAAALAYLYTACSGLIGAALRLIPLGQLRGQQIIHNVVPLIISLADQATGKGIDEMSSFAPGLEIAAMRHARLEARLFRS